MNVQIEENRQKRYRTNEIPQSGHYAVYVSYQVLSFILNGVSLKSVRLRKRFRI